MKTRIPAILALTAALFLVSCVGTYDPGFGNVYSPAVVSPYGHAPVTYAHSPGYYYEPSPWQAVHHVPQQRHFTGGYVHNSWANHGRIPRCGSCGATSCSGSCRHHRHEYRSDSHSSGRSSSASSSKSKSNSSSKKQTAQSSKKESSSSGNQNSGSNVRQIKNVRIVDGKIDGRVNQEKRR